MRYYRVLVPAHSGSGTMMATVTVTVTATAAAAADIGPNLEPKPWWLAMQWPSAAEMWLILLG